MLLQGLAPTIILFIFLHYIHVRFPYSHHSIILHSFLDVVEVDSAVCRVHMAHNHLAAIIVLISFSPLDLNDDLTILLPECI